MLTKCAHQDPQRLWQTPMQLAIKDEFAPLTRVIIGLGAPYQRNKARVRSEFEDYTQVPDTEHKAAVLALDYPLEAQLETEYAALTTTLTKLGVEVQRADPNRAYSFDYTCPRDIAFVVDDSLIIANMAVPSRAQEFETIRPLFEGLATSKILKPPPGARLEGGDVV